MITINRNNPTPGEITSSLTNSTDAAGLHFDGAAGNIDIASPPDLGTKFSFELIIQADSLSGGTNVDYLVAFQNGGNFIFGHHSGNIGIYSVGAPWTSFAVNPLSDLKVHHLVLTVSDTAAILYDNGSQISSKTINSPDIDSTTAARFGSNHLGTSGLFNGTYYRARFWNKTLSQAEVTASYENATVPFADQYGSQTSKILNGTDWTGATGTTVPTSWSAGTTGTYTIDSAAGSGAEPALRINRTGTSDNPYTYQTFTSIIGKKYRVTYKAKNGTATSMRVGVGSTSTGIEYDYTDYTTTSWVEFDETFTATTTLFSVYAQVRTTTGTEYAYIDSVKVDQIGCVADYDLAFAQPEISTMVQDRAGAADGTSSASGVTQVTPIEQLNSKSARIGTSAATPADGELLVSGQVGVGTDSPGASLEIRKQFTDTTAVERVLILDTHDDSAVLPLDAGDGVGILFKIPEATGSAIGASIDAEKTSSADGDTSTQLVFRTSQNDETLDTALTISSAGDSTFSGAVSVGTGSANYWTLNGNATGQPVYVNATGSDTNIGFDFNSKGTGNHQLNVNGITRLNVSTTGVAVTGNATFSSDISTDTFSATGVTAGFTSNQDATDCEWKYSSSTTGTGVVFRFYNPNGNVGVIYTNGSATVYATSSDYRLKENVTEITGALDRIDLIPAYRFNFKADPTKTVDGFFAHEVAEQVPESIIGTKDEMQTVVTTEAVEAIEAVAATYYEEGDELPDGVAIGDEKTPAVEAVEAVAEVTEEQPKYQGIDQSKLVPLMLAAIKELKAKVTALENA